MEEFTDIETSVTWESTDHKEEDTDTEDSVSWESTEGDEKEVSIQQTVLDKKEKPWTQDKPDEKEKSNLKFSLWCVFVIIAAFSLFGIIIYFVQEEQNEVFAFWLISMSIISWHFTCKPHSRGLLLLSLFPTGHRQSQHL